MISKRDSIPFKVKFPIGESDEDVKDMIYEDDWQTEYGLIKTSGLFDKKIYGIDLDFDLVMVVNANPLTRRINKQCLFLVNDMPTNIFENGDYTPKHIFPEYNGEISIGLSKKEDIAIPRLYFAVGENILHIQINFDSETKKAYIPRTQTLPFKVGDYVWTRRPADSTQTEHRLKLTSTKVTGLSDNFIAFLELSFEAE